MIAQVLAQGWGPSLPGPLQSPPPAALTAPGSQGLGWLAPDWPGEALVVHTSWERDQLQLWPQVMALPPPPAVAKSVLWWEPMKGKWETKQLGQNCALPTVHLAIH